MIETIQKEQIQAFSTKASGANACSIFEIIGTQCGCGFSMFSSIYDGKWTS